jgi:outer membrane protein TolC
MLKLLLSIAVLGGVAGPVAAQQAKLDELAKLKLEAARRTFEAYWQAYQAGRVLMDPLHIWSCRWLEAEPRENGRLAIAALRAHLERMRDLKKIVDAKFQAGQIGQIEALSTVYFVAEAELWIMEAEQKAKPK